MSLEAIPSALFCDFLADAPDYADMAEFPTPLYSRKQVVKAGKALCEPMPWSDDRAEEYRQVFKVAYDWRASHAYPMRKLRQELRNTIRDQKAKGLTAARLKRMKSVRKKLERLNTTLAQIQDIGGCRAIVDTQATMNALLDRYRSQSTLHKLREDRSYIDKPRLSGYRSHHLVFDFQPETVQEEHYRDRRIEVQLRSRIQHSWATAVESIGLYRNEDLKAGEGDADWLRFFLLVSGEFAAFEQTAPVPYVPEDRAARVAEIAALDRRLDAVRRLETLNQAFKFADANTTLGSSYFLIQFDSVLKTMKIVGYDRIARASEQYGIEEAAHRALNTVVVEVDTLHALKEAYPNYFLDVRLFTQNVVHILKGEPLVTSLKRVDMEQTSQGHVLSWMGDYYRALAKRRKR